MKQVVGLAKDFFQFSPTQFDRLSDFTSNLSLLLFGTTIVPILFSTLDNIVWSKIILGTVVGTVLLLISLLLAKEVK